MPVVTDALLVLLSLQRLADIEQLCVHLLVITLNPINQHPGRPPSMPFGTGVACLVRCEYPGLGVVL
ncbi:unnamed protein product [Haemonchus placei]|uniref:Secreted protein n=1 Tax=Haemonchus placei TaxID=6290 RepID=A0A0N4VWL0_HAEPC|nr:unnamed protein product [Haemonchus placei]